MVRVLAVVIVWVLTHGVAAAHDQVLPTTTLVPAAVAEEAPLDALVAPLTSRPDSITTPRPLSFSFLYVTHAALHVFDGYSTLHALERQATEENPLMKPVVSSPAGFLAVKASAATLVIYAAERLRKHDHGVAAFLLMLGSNVFLSYVAINNARVLARW